MVSTSPLKDKKLNIVFRWDAGKKFGNGHFMRCMVLGGELINRGHTVTVLSRQVPHKFKLMLFEIGIIVKIIRNDGNGLTELSELNKIKNIDWLIIDHYHVQASWETDARKFTLHIMVIDDLANRQHDCDLLLDQNIPNKLHKQYDYLVPAHCIKAIGWEYLLARPSFYVQNNQAQSGTLVFLGGGDKSIELSKLIKKLLNHSELHPIKVLVTSEYFPLDHWKSIIGEYGTVHCDLVDPAALYGSAALALVRCGFVSYELALLGISTVNIYSTSVQTEVARSLEFHGVGVALSELNLNNDSALHEALNRAVALNLLALNRKLIYGANAVAELLEKTNE